MTPFTLPDLGEGLQQAEIVAWHVSKGEHVVADQPLLSVETEKAVVDIPSPQAGHIGQLLVGPGDRVAVGAPLLLFEEGVHPDVGTVVGELEGPEGQPRDVKAPAVTSEKTEGGGNVRAAPAVRARARELGIDLSKVTPSGPQGAITMADVMRSAAVTPGTAGGLSGARRAMALNMIRAGREVVHATLHDTANIEGWPEHEDVTVRLVRAVIAACKAQPLLNARFEPETLSLYTNECIDLGLAINSSDGLFVPVLRDVAKSQPVEWRRQIDGFKRGVQERSLSPADFRNPTITLSNFGTIAGTHASLVVMPPQVAILGAGRITERPARALPLSLTFDHRAITGGEGAHFLRAVIDDLQRAT